MESNELKLAKASLTFLILDVIISIGFGIIKINIFWNSILSKFIPNLVHLSIIQCILFSIAMGSLGNTLRNNKQEDDILRVFANILTSIILQIVSLIIIFIISKII